MSAEGKSKLAGGGSVALVAIVAALADELPAELVPLVERLGAGGLAGGFVVVILLLLRVLREVGELRQGQGSLDARVTELERHPPPTARRARA